MLDKLVQKKGSFFWGETRSTGVVTDVMNSTSAVQTQMSQTPGQQGIESDSRRALDRQKQPENGRL